MKTCILCKTPLKFRKYDYLNLIKIVHEKCNEEIEREGRAIKRQANIQRVKHSQELRFYSIKRLLDNEVYRKTEEIKVISEFLISYKPE